jgi:hypothetical protein
VPTVQASLDKYLKSILPLVDEEDYNQTKSLIEVFMRKGGQGNVAQNLEKIGLILDSVASAILCPAGGHHLTGC